MRRSFACLLAVALCAACPRREPSADSPSQAPVDETSSAQVPADAALMPAAASNGPTLHKSQRTLMGTIWSITVAGGDAVPAKQASERALDEVDRLEQLLSEWRPDSDISQVNKQAGIKPVQVSPELLACVRASLEIARWSHGAFDISWAALRGLWDFSADSAQVPPTPQQVRALLPLWNYKNIVLDEEKSTVFLKKKGMQIGLGGVAKGYALDRVGEVLLEAGFENFLVYAGGQVLVHGRRGDRAWRVGIQHPREQRHFAFVEIESGSLATSGDYEHAFKRDGRTYHHIIDPKTGFPSELTSSVTLVAKTALWADAVDTAVFIMGPKEGLAALADAPGGPFDVAIVDPTMHLVLSPHMKERLVMTAEIADDGRIGMPVAPP